MKNKNTFFIGATLVVIVAGIAAYTLYKHNKTSGARSLATYSQKPKASTNRVVVVIGGSEGDVDQTVQSILNQSVQVDEIATCKKGDDPNDEICKSVVNKYGDPFGKGLVKSTFDRELDASTIVVFLKRGEVFENDGQLASLMAKWTPDNPVIVENPSILITTESQT
jgi:hypothetical protein